IATSAQGSINLSAQKNIEVAVDETVKNGAFASGTICFTISPIHNLDAYVKLAKQMEDMGVGSIAIKDMAGIMGPQEAFDLVKALKENVKLPIVCHTHSTTGLGLITLLKAVEAGADIIDTAISCMSGGTSQPPTETLAYAFKQLGYDVDLNMDAVNEVNEFFKPYKARALETGLLNPVVLSTETDALNYQIPGGMLSNLVAQLTAQNKLDKLPEVLAETPRVRKDLGYPPLVTPMSQMVGVQATANVLSGERYKNISKEVKSYIRGEYGKAPGKVSKELEKIVLGDDKPITERFANTLKPEFERAKSELGDIAKSDEDVLSYIAFPAQAEKFFEKRAQKEKNTFSYTITKLQ
ncbi:MAG: pyruvate carboxylase subunit B, partial [Oscillospiraceae bacterium]